ncbi:hypothetical protein P7C70_g4239, partial [Phenoliferia sp. Uapishka_3]
MDLDAMLEAATVSRPPLSVPLPPLPPQTNLQSTHSSAAGEKDPFAGWDNIPLFMKSLPSDLGGVDKPSGGDDGIALEALQALMYDGEPSEIAADLKAQGNSLFSAKKYRDAIGFYTRALDECGKEIGIQDKRTLWCNRAAANLELGTPASPPSFPRVPPLILVPFVVPGNYGATLRDISLVLSAPLESYPEPPSAAYQKTTAKALLRSARALSGLEKLEEAMDSLSRLKLLESDLEGGGDSGEKIRAVVEGKLEKKRVKEAEKSEKERRVREGEARMREALGLAGVKLPKEPTIKGKAKLLFSNCPIDITPPHFDPDALLPHQLPSHPLLPPTASSSTYIPFSPPPPTTPLIFPTFLLLPNASPPTRDLCLSFHTLSTFSSFLESMEHDPSSLQLYIATVKGRVLKVGGKLTLGKVLAAAGKDGDGWELKEGWALEIVGVEKGTEGEKFLEGWKEEVKKGVGAIL